MQELFNSIFETNEQTIGVGSFLLCILFGLIVGAMYYFSYTFKNKVTTSFKTSVALLPVVVCVVIMMVNGNIGIGVAIAGAFSLVRFRSAQGNAKEIVVIFMTMCSGLILGVGYLAYATLFTLIMCLLILGSNIISKKVNSRNQNRVLKVTIPEDLDYEDVFADIFNNYLEEVELKKVKTTNMGSLFRLTYDIKLKKDKSEKELIDELRIKNGNLEIMILKDELENTL